MLPPHILRTSSAILRNMRLLVQYDLVMVDFWTHYKYVILTVLQKLCPLSPCTYRTHPEPLWGLHTVKLLEKINYLRSTETNQAHWTTVESWWAFTLIFRLFPAAFRYAHKGKFLFCRRTSGLTDCDTPLMCLYWMLFPIAFFPVFPAVLCSPSAVLLKAKSFCRALRQCQVLCRTTWELSAFTWLRT